MNILAQIVESKKREIAALRERHDAAQLSESLKLSESSRPPVFYQRLGEARASRKPFFITEFKRKSPSEGWINAEIPLPEQIQKYAEAGASAISVLTDEAFFGGNYEDLKLARYTLDHLPLSATRPLLLQKDFVLDPLQIYLAKECGADIILLIAAILTPAQLDFLRQTAEEIGLGVLVEVHDKSELEKIQPLDFPVLGINSRDLTTFRTALNRVNFLKNQAGGRFVVAESGILDHRHFQMLRTAEGFLIGTSLMRQQGFPLRVDDFFQTEGRYLFKACGIRSLEMLGKLLPISPSENPAQVPDFIGLNFSPLSRRRVGEPLLQNLGKFDFERLVGVFYKNSEAEIREILQRFSFKTVQFYAGDVTPKFVRSLKARTMLAVKISDMRNWDNIFSTWVEPYAPDVDCFILDGANPGSGERIGAEIPPDFPYPFLLAGGLREENLDSILSHPNCIGADIASGIETNGEADFEKIKRIALMAHGWQPAA